LKRLVEATAEAGKLVRRRDSGRDPGRALFVLTDRNSDISEAYRALRTSILLSTPDAPPQVLLFSSALPQEGKTTTSSNLAILLAQKGGKVLLVDADLRRPSMHRMFSIHSRVGLSTVLAGMATAQEAIAPCPSVPNLYLLPAGPPAPHPAELVGSASMRSLLQELRREYDYILLDSPPVLAVTDAVLLSLLADSVVLVARSSQTPKQSLRRAAGLFLQANANIAGVVLNATDLSSSSYYSYYGYYGGKYYGYSSDEDEKVSTPEAAVGSDR
jgi:capsular exopolysaccharide synthesis family protein